MGVLKTNIHHERKLAMSNKNTQAVPATEGQLKQIVRIVHDSVPDTKWIEEHIFHLGLDKIGAQKLIESGDELHTVRKFLSDKIKELSDSLLYSDEVVKSSYGYLSGYYMARPVEEQIATLRQHDWGRVVDWSLNKAQQQMLAKPKPQGSEGYFAVVFDRTMVTHHDDDLTVDQSIPVTRVLRALHRHKYDVVEKYNDGELRFSYYRRIRNSTDKMKQLWESQGSPKGILLIPAQLGLAHAGKSVLRARVVMRGSEFPLDAYEVLQMILTHDDRLRHYHDLWINLPGGEYSPDVYTCFNSSMYIGFSDGVIVFGYYAVNEPYRYFGSASGFLMPVIKP